MILNKEGKILYRALVAIIIPVCTILLALVFGNEWFLDDLLDDFLWNCMDFDYKSYSYGVQNAVNALPGALLGSIIGLILSLIAKRIIILTSVKNGKYTKEKDVVKKDVVKNRASKFLKIIAIVIVILFGGVGVVIGILIGDELLTVVFAAIGVLLGFISAALLFYFAELGTNVKKATDATVDLSKSKDNALNQLQDGKALLDSGAITQEEYEKLKRQLLG